MLVEIPAKIDAYLGTDEVVMCDSCVEVRHHQTWWLVDLNLWNRCYEARCNRLDWRVSQRRTLYDDSRTCERID